MERRDRENYTQGLYWFTLSKSYIQSLVKTTEYFTMQPITDYTYTTQRGDFESHKAYSTNTSLHTTNTSSQNHTDFTRFYNSFTESNMNNYKNQNRVRKHLESQYTRNPIDQFFESQQSSKAILLKLGKTPFHKQLVISHINHNQSIKPFCFMNLFTFERRLNL